MVLLWEILYTDSVSLEIVNNDALEVLVRILLRVHGLYEQVADRVTPRVPPSLHPLDQHVVHVDATHTDFSRDDRCRLEAPEEGGTLKDQILYVCLFE